jgi:hypothetical protein
VNGSRNINGGGATKNCGTTRSGETIGDGGARASINMRGPLLAFSLVMNFLMNFNEITKGLKLKNCEACMCSNVRLMKACKKPMHICVG